MNVQKELELMQDIAALQSMQEDDDAYFTDDEFMKEYQRLGQEIDMLQDVYGGIGVTKVSKAFKSVKQQYEDDIDFYSEGIIEDYD
jgi:hypothetical protein